MMTNQNSLNYSDNDSAELQLDPGIQSYIAPNVTGSVEVKFDGYGTLHVLERNEYGKLLSDSYIAKQEDDIAQPRHEYTNMDKLNDISRKNAILRKAVVVQKILIVLFVIMFILFCLVLKITLQRYM